MFKRVKTWLAQSYPCHYCGGTGRQSNLGMVGNQFRSWGGVALVIAILILKLWPAPPPAVRALVWPAAPVPR